MMLADRLKNIAVILASQSPRRKELLASMDIDFTVEVRSVDESVGEGISAIAAAEFIALKKLDAFAENAYFDQLVITSDTVVVDPDNEVLGKPEGKEEARQVLRNLSGKEHQVYTGVAFQLRGERRSFTCKTDVQFNVLSEEEVAYYVEKYKPYDKAGSYGIQEWIGRIGVDRIVGSYENVMGLPTSRLYKELKEFLK